MFELTKIRKEMDFLLSATAKRKYSGLYHLDKVLMKKKGSNVEFTSADFEKIAYINVPIGGQTGVDLNALVFLKMANVKAVNEIEKDENGVVVWNGMPLVTLPSANFQRDVEYYPSSAVGVSKKIGDALVSAAPFATRDTLKPALCGVHVYNRSSIGKKLDEIVVEASNGHYLYHKVLKINSRKGFDFIVPKTAMMSLKKLMEIEPLNSISISRRRKCDDWYIMFSAGVHRLEVRLIDERFPSCDDLIYISKDIPKVEINPKEFFELVDEIRKTGPLDNSHNLIVLSGSKASCNNPETGLSVEKDLPFTMPCRVPVGYDINLLHRILKNIEGDTCTWYFNTVSDLKGSVFISKDGVRYLLMPIRINN